MRVIKAEDVDVSPWTSVALDVVSRTLNDHFAACDEREADTAVFDRDSIQSCRKMAVALVESVTKATGGTAIREAMTQAEIDPTSSPLGSVVNDSLPSESQRTTKPIPPARPQTPSRGVATLVSALGSAQSQSERETALQALRQYTADYGDEDLHLHLEQVSPTFRNFILEQLSPQGNTEDENESVGSSSMAERLRNLRSRLQDEKLPPSGRLVPPSPSRVRAPASHSDASVDTGAVSTSSTSATSRQSLRERLAAAQASRSNSIVAPETASTSGSRAAALRARLQAVKQQSLQSTAK